MTKVDVLGVGVSAEGADEIVRRLVESAGSGRRERIVCVNVHTWTEARRNPRYAAALESAEIAIADGMPIAWASRLLGRPCGGRLAGPDLFLRMLAEPVSHFFYGSTPTVLEDLQRQVRALFPKAVIAGAISPPFRREPALEDAHAEAINGSGAQMLWVALGAPKQELWMHVNRPRVVVPVMAGVGGAFEMVAGHVRRAPALLRRAGLEWLWRLSQDPARLWRRYLSTNGFFLSTLALRLSGM